MKFIYLSLILVLGMSCSSKKNQEISPADKKANIYYTQGTNELVRGQYHNALKNLRIAARYREKDTKIQNNLGMAYYHRKSYSNAIKHLKLAIKFDAKNLDARLNLANIYTNLKKYPEAEENYKYILKDLEFTAQDKTYHNYGNMYFKQGKYRAAAKLFKKSLSVNESYCPSSFKLGIIYKKSKHIEKAYKYFKDSGNGVCYVVFDPFKEQIISLVLMQRFPEAKKLFRETQERFSDHDVQMELKKIKKYIALKESQMH